MLPYVSIRDFIEATNGVSVLQFVLFWAAIMVVWLILGTSTE